MINMRGSTEPPMLHIPYQNFVQRINLGLAQLRSSASQRRVFACGSMGRSDRFVCGISALRAENHTPLNMEYRSAEGWQGQLMVA
jgi:hypothetical protein